MRNYLLVADHGNEKVNVPLEEVGPGIVCFFILEMHDYPLSKIGSNLWHLGLELLTTGWIKALRFP